MKFSHSITINAPREKVVEIFSNPDNRKHWHPDLESTTQVSGEPGTVGAVSKMLFGGKRPFELIETITVNNLPDELSGEYETLGTCWNEMKNFFSEVSPNQTKYVTEIDYKFYMTFLTIMSYVAPSMFKKPVKKTLELFKEYVERVA